VFIGFLVFIEHFGLKFYELNKPKNSSKSKKPKDWGE